MPHFIVEYSANLADRHDMGNLARTIADEAAATGIFPLAGIRVRLYDCRDYLIADGHEKNAFVSIMARIGAGRDETSKKRAASRIFDAVCAFFKDEFTPENIGHLMISFDMVESDSAVSFKKNGVRERLADK